MSPNGGVGEQRDQQHADDQQEAHHFAHWMASRTVPSLASVVANSCLSFG
jgi:hypothetical protein